eukprot:jgi/Psemu1/7525/gm1.7525_g
MAQTLSTNEHLWEHLCPCLTKLKWIQSTSAVIVKLESLRTSILVHPNQIVRSRTSSVVSKAKEGRWQKDLCGQRQRKQPRGTQYSYTATCLQFIYRESVAKCGADQLSTSLLLSVVKPSTSVIIIGESKNKSEDKVAQKMARIDRSVAKDGAGNKD